MNNPTYRDGFNLARALIDGSIDRRPRVALRGGAVQLGGEVDVDSKERLSVRGLPCRHKRLPACIPGSVGRINTAWVESDNV